MKRCIVIIAALALIVSACADGDKKTNIATSIGGGNAQATQTRQVELAELATVRAGTGSASESSPVSPATATSSNHATATAKATEPPKSTSTPKPTATVTEAPTKADLTIAQWHVVERKYSDGVDIVGVVINNGSGIAGDVAVVASVYDTNGTILGSEKAFEVMPLIPGGSKSPFSIHISKVDATQVASEKTKVEGQFKTVKASDFEAKYYTTELTLDQVQWSADKITGQLTNKFAKTVKYPRVLLVGYDGDGNAVAVESVSGDLDQLDPEQSTTFTDDLYQGYDTPASFEAFAYASIAQ